MTRKRVAVLIVIGLILALAGYVWLGPDPPEPPPRAAPTELGQVDVTPATLEQIEPGTIINDGPPSTWSHLVHRSHSRVGPETIDDISQYAADVAGLLFTAILADVKPVDSSEAPAAFRLDRVAIGVGKQVDGQPMILTPQSQEQLGAELGFVDRQVLAGGLKQFRKMRCVARSSTMAVLDSPGVLLLEQQHRKVMLRYAILVHPDTGRLETLLWAWTIAEEGRPSEIVSPLHRLPVSAVEDCLLHADPKHFVLGVPTAMAYARIGLPESDAKYDVPDALRPVALMSPMTLEAARQLQRQLWNLLRPTE